MTKFVAVREICQKRKRKCIERMFNLFMSRTQTRFCFVYKYFVFLFLLFPKQ